MNEDDSLLGDVPLWLLVVVAIGLAVAILSMGGCAGKKPTRIYEFRNVHVVNRNGEEIRECEAGHTAIDAHTGRTVIFCK